ncbi:MAG: hypothetical protein MZU84_07725 [Sphingobacterium sp.]|nr:hypothetical protein [Sphingobacterium sp.]
MKNAQGREKIDGAKEAVTRFMKNIPDDVNIGLMLIRHKDGDDYAEALPIGSGNKEEFLKIINSLQPTERHHWEKQFRRVSTRLLSNTRSSSAMVHTVSSLSPTESRQAST